MRWCSLAASLLTVCTLAACAADMATTHKQLGVDSYEITFHVIAYTDLESQSLGAMTDKSKKLCPHGYNKIKSWDTSDKILGGYDLYHHWQIQCVNPI